ncbi:uncharacterized protein N7443_008234 [Penicillium atrosanguineum]|uniref:uncharacterized protein n=1 Tax=Penicillium atrosanguineum TaxID=1132637 RepID=UPI0023A10AA3|nr:uncharacterized protein N7443_008234 [Penicillium atrosanguineum]KAJ5292281.1 hypothetical protein N7443_008234 [Penicillium atrosanguineum]
MPISNSLGVATLVWLNPHDEAQLVQRLQDHVGKTASVQIWHLPKAKLLRPIGERDYPLDSKGNIFHAAALAHREGLSSIFVADSLTKRQLKEDLRPGEDPLLSVVMVRIRRQGADQNDRPFRVIAKRHTVEGVANILYLLNALEISPSFLNRNGNNKDHGIELHDPDRAVFEPNRASSTGRENHETSITAALLQSFPLPTELCRAITSMINNRAHFQPKKTAGLLRGSHHGTVIMLSFPATPGEIEELRVSVELSLRDRGYHHSGPVGSMKIQLVPWTNDYQATRRDLEMHWNQTHHPKLCPIWYLLAPPQRIAGGYDLERAQWAAIYHGSNDGIFIARKTFQSRLMESISPQSFRRSAATQFQDRLADQLSIDPDRVEIFCSPDSPLYLNPPMWEPVDSAGITSIALFYLTNQLPEEQQQTLKTELHTLNDMEDDYEDEDYNKACCFVPWAEEGENVSGGTVDDMWEVFWGMYQLTTFEMPIFFIDDQSGIDQTVLVVYPDHCYNSDEDAQSLMEDVNKPKVNGMLYGRIKGRDAHMAWMDLRDVSMDFDECVRLSGQDEEHQYPVPR